MRVKQVRKVRRQRRPGYPTRPEVARDPELLRRHVPSAWKKSAQVTAALSIVLASAYAQDAPSKAKGFKVAPIFEHGEGRGATGCVVMTPPQFLAEDDALRIIIQEMEKAGIPTPDRGKSFRDITYGENIFPPPPDKDGTGPWTPDLLEGDRKPIVFDLYEPLEGIVIEYVSSTGRQFAVTDQDKFLSRFSSVVSYDLLDAAKRLRRNLERNRSHRNLYCGVFYDPGYSHKTVDSAKISLGPDNDAKRKDAVESLNPSPADLLRAQVKDFIEWLKGQGAI